MTTIVITAIIASVLGFFFALSIFKPEGEPAKESVLRNYSGNTLTVLSSHSIPFERWVRHTLQESGERHITLFLLRHDDNHRTSDKLIYCYTSIKFEIEEKVRIEFTPSQLLNYSFPGNLITVDLMSESSN